MYTSLFFRSSSTIFVTSIQIRCIPLFLSYSFFIPLSTLFFDEYFNKENPVNKLLLLLTDTNLKSITRLGCMVFDDLTC